jgi:hypothetical protein
MRTGIYPEKGVAKVYVYLYSYHVADRDDDKVQLDFNRMEFPSDRITVREIREREPLTSEHIPDFDRNDRKNDALSPDGRLVPHPSIMTVMFYERLVALVAFDISMGKGPNLDDWCGPAMGMTPKEHDDCLISAYMTYQMAGTTHEAKQLVRTIKEQAWAQAREAQGRDPDAGPKR